MLQTQDTQLKRRARELEILAAHAPSLFSQDSLEDIYATAGVIIHEYLGYTCALFRCDSESWRLMYISISNAAKALARKMTGLDADDFSIPGTFGLFQEILDKRDAVFIEDSREHTLQGLQEVYSRREELKSFLARGMDAIVDIIMSRVMPTVNQGVIVAPILHGEHVLGNITIFGKTLGIDDLPTIQHFATLVGTAIAQKIAENALMESEQRYRTLFESVSEGILVADLMSMRLMYANKAACRIFGYSNHEFYKMTLDSILPEKSPPASPDKAVSTLSEDSLEARCKDGGSVFLNVTYKHSVIDGADCLVAFCTDVTLQRQHERALRESEATARALLDAPTDAAFLIDIHGKVLDCNANGAARFGLTREQMLGTYILKHFAGEISTYREKAVYRVIETGAPLRLEDERNGIWNDSVIYPVTDESGKVSKIAILARDITMRKQTEEQLRRSEENFRSLTEEINDGVVVHIDNKCYWCNRAFTKLFGLDREDIIGRDISFLFAPEEGEMLNQSQDRLDLNEVSSMYEVRARRMDGTFFDGEVIAKKITFDDNMAVLFIMRDITERKRADAALKKSERRYRSVIEDVDAYICRFTQDGTLTFVNEEYCKYFRMKRDELIGRNLFDFIPEAEREEVRDRYQLLERDVPTVTYEQCVFDPDGSLRWQRWTDRAIFDDQGNLTEFQSVGFDTTDRRIAEERITALSRKVISSQEQERARLSRELHDEMGQQLSAIQLVLESMLSRPQPDRDYIELIAERIEDLTIEVRRICKGLRPVILDTFGFHMSLENLIHEFRENFDMDIRYVPTSKDKYPMPPDAAISTYRIAQEALTNAIRHSGGAPITVRLHADENQVQLDVEDEGPGFDPEKAPGSGLGLVGMRERAALCNAELILDAAPGQGTRILLTVPLNKPRTREDSE